MPNCCRPQHREFDLKGVAPLRILDRFQPQRADARDRVGNGSTEFARMLAVVGPLEQQHSLSDQLFELIHGLEKRAHRADWARRRQRGTA